MGDAAAPPPGPPPHVVGRERERARIEEFVASVPGRACAFVLSGDAGIGKTTLWRHALDRCRGEGFDVLVTRPAEEEMPLPLVGLADLFAQPDEDAALLRFGEEPLGRGRAVLAELRRVAATRPVVIAIDDAQWLDSTSARALRYALRRLDGEPIGLLETVRPGVVGDDPLRASGGLPPGRTEVVDLGPLDLDELRAVLGGTVAAISRPLLSRIHQASGGNPLYAVELLRAVGNGDATKRTLVLPDSLQAAIAEHLSQVPATLEPLLEVAATLGRTSVRELRETLPDEDVEHLLSLAEEHGILLIGDDLSVRFAHPLLASAVYGRLSPLARRSVHARLATRALDDDVKARHVALSTDEPDEDVARLLEDAAGRARSRGASDLAADFARHSFRLTPPTEADAARRRAHVEIVSRAAAGEASVALALADRLVAELPPGPARAEALVDRFYVGDDHLEAGDALLVRALEDAGDDDALRGRVLDMLGWLRGMFRGRVGDGVECAREALAIADRVGDARLQLLAAGHLGHMENLAGRPRPDLMARAMALAEELGGPPLGGDPRAWRAKQLLWAGDASAARVLFEAALADNLRSGNELERPYRLYDLALLECATGDLVAAQELTRQGIEAARDAENVDAEGWLLFPLGLVEAWSGRGVEARVAADRLLTWARRRGGLPWIVRAKSVLGLLALSEDSVDVAAAELTEAAAMLQQMEFAHPGALPALPDAVDAVARSGDEPAAAALLARLEGQSAAVDSAWARAACERARGSLLLARGDASEAAAAFALAAESFDALGFRPGAARSVLGRGRALLRAGHRSVAATALADARVRFARMGATAWEARAVEELERASPGRAAGELTATEQRVAALVADGLKNREIGRTLFMSVATVEAHLTRIYRKLDIRSRSDLARLVAAGTVDVSAGELAARRKQRGAVE